jgi:2,3-diaminopropionate biosynthesis protein SbnA
MIYHRAYEILPDDVFLALDGVLDDSVVQLKIEGLNPAGSIKVKTAIGLIEDLERTGVLRPGGHVIESSSGNLGISLGMVCAAKGYAFTCVCDVNTSADSIAFMRSTGAEVVVIDQRDANGGYLGSRISYIKTRLELEENLVWTNQYANPAGPEVHARRTAAAILRELGRVDYLFVGAGTTGTLMGCVQFFRRASPRTCVIAVDAQGSVTFGFPPGPRYIPGVGTSRRPELCRPELVDDVVLVEELDAVRTCRWLAARTGLLTGGSTGSVVAAVLQRRYDIPAGSVVVAVSPDLGDRYLHTIYSDAWVAETFGLGLDEVAELDTATALRKELV